MLNPFPPSLPTFDDFIPERIHLYNVLFPGHGNVFEHMKLGSFLHTWTHDRISEEAIDLLEYTASLPVEENVMNTFKKHGFYFF